MSPSHNLIQLHQHTAIFIYYTSGYVMLLVCYNFHSLMHNLNTPFFRYSMPSLLLFYTSESFYPAFYIHPYLPSLCVSIPSADVIHFFSAVVLFWGITLLHFAPRLPVNFSTFRYHFHIVYIVFDSLAELGLHFHHLSTLSTAV